MADREWTWADGVSTVWRSRYLVVAVTLLASVLTALVMLAIPRTYEAVVTVRIGRVMDKLIEDPVQAAAIANSSSIVSRIGAKFPERSPDDLLDAISAVPAGTASAPVPYLTIGARARNAEEAVRLVVAVAGVITDDHHGRYERLMERHRRYRDDLKAQIATISSEIDAMQVALKAIRDPAMSALAMVLTRSQLAEKRIQLVGYTRELRDVDVALNGLSEETRVIGTPVVPGSRMRPRRALNTSAGAATGGLLAIFWVVASGGVRRRGGTAQ